VDGRVAIQLANGSQLRSMLTATGTQADHPREGLAPTTTHRLQNILRVISGEVGFVAPSLWKFKRCP